MFFFRKLRRSFLESFYGNNFLQHLEIWLPSLAFCSGKKFAQQNYLLNSFMKCGLTGDLPWMISTTTSHPGLAIMAKQKNVRQYPVRPAASGRWYPDFLMINTVQKDVMTSLSACIAIPAPMRVTVAPNTGRKLHWPG